MNNELIKILYKYPRFDELKTEVLNIIQEVNTSFPSWGITGISFQYRNASEKIWIEEPLPPPRIPPLNEEEFCILQPQLVGTEIEKLFNSINFKMYRTRIMLMLPGASYPVHSDLTPRIHIPIVTNEKCRFKFPNISTDYANYMPADGSIYRADTTEPHLFANESDQTRIHIIGSLGCDNKVV